MNKKTVLILLLAIVGLVCFALGQLESEKTEVEKDVLSLSYTIDGEVFDMEDGLATKTLAMESSFMPTLRVFGEPVYADLNADGIEDAAMYLEYQPGGSGTFYYAALAMSEDGVKYKETPTMFLGDRIAPQSLDIEEGRAIYNFAERRAEESFATAPSVGRSVYVHYDKNTRQIGEWMKDFTGEANYTERYSGQVDRVKVIFEHFNFITYRLVTNGQVRSGELNTERGYKDDVDATVYVLDWQKEEVNQLRYVRLTSEPGKLYLLNSDGDLVAGSVLNIEE